MNIKVVCVGKLKEKYWKDAINEYLKRLTPYCTVEIIELREARLTSVNDSAISSVKKEEGISILSKLQREDYVISLEIKGDKLSSQGLAKKLDELALNGKSRVCFVIGGSYGIDEAVSDRADMKLSFSDMTYPHQLMRVILLEQIYRSFNINNGGSYHK